MTMYEATAKRNFTWSKFSGKEFKKGQKIKNLSEADKEYLNGNNPKHISVIKDIREIVIPEIETAVEVVPENVEKAVKNTKGKTTKK